MNRYRIPRFQHISESFIQPQHSFKNSEKPFNLSRSDLSMLSVRYIEMGILCAMPPEAAINGDRFIKTLLHDLKHSLSIALVYFYPLAGKLATRLNVNEASCLVYVDCIDGPGVKFIHERLDTTISDINRPNHLALPQAFFDHNSGEISNHGHVIHLLTVKITQLLDGIFIGCSMNHCIGDDTYFLHFLYLWSDIFQSIKDNGGFSFPAWHQLWFPHGHDQIHSLPFAYHHQVISRPNVHLIMRTLIHFSKKALLNLDGRVNVESRTNKISFIPLSLCALVWRCITRSRHLPKDQITSCRLALKHRHRAVKGEQWSSDFYFRNSIETIRGFTTAGELMENPFGWAAGKLYGAVADYSDTSLRDGLLHSSIVYQKDELFDGSSVMIGSSEKFEGSMNIFGMGRPLNVTSGYEHRYDGEVICYQEGETIDVELFLSPNSMSALQADQEFMGSVRTY